MPQPQVPTARQRSAKASRFRRSRRGVSTMWTLLLAPAAVIFLCVVVDIANLWLARVELENALEAAALASVKEWGDANGAALTLPARNVGVAYAAANQAGGPGGVSLDNNYLAANVPNENASCDGNLVFGAITSTSPTVVFNAGVRPSCGLGNVLIDVTSNASLQAENAWGVSFRNTPTTPANLLISQVIIDLQAGSDSDATFDFDTNPPVLSTLTTIPPTPDVSGFASPATQIAFSPSAGSPSQLTITFSPGGGDAGFEPGDRIRFGARAKDLSSGNGNNDGDGVGIEAVQVTIIFTLGGVPQSPQTATLADSTFGNNPSGIADLPTPAPSSAQNNDGQSFVELLGAGNNAMFAVRARAAISVSGLCTNLFGTLHGAHGVSAETVAVYDCATHRPRLIRVDQFICPGP
jgi:Flp pilus assembly protein TadG